MRPSKEQIAILKVVEQYVPKEDMGVKEAFYRSPDAETIDFLFIIDKESANIAASYIRSLFSSLEQKFDGVDIKLSIYIYERNKRLQISKIVKDRAYSSAQLVSSFA